MTHDDLLSDLGRIARERPGDDPNDASVSDLLRARMLRAAEAELPKKRGRSVAIAIGGLAAAAAVTIAVFASRAPEVPDYRAEVVGGTSEVRSDPATQRGVISASGEVEILVRPTVAVRGDVAAVAFAAHEGVTRAWIAPIEVSPEGVVRVVGETRALFSPPSGQWRLTFAIGRRSELPSRAEALRPSRDVRIVTVDLTIEP
jgi:hypothetical protein